jgi:hypothetical protein
MPCHNQIGKIKGMELSVAYYNYMYNNILRFRKWLSRIDIIAVSMVGKFEPPGKISPVNFKQAI